MGVNKLLTFINHNCDKRKEDNSSLDESDRYTDVSQTYIYEKFLIYIYCKSSVRMFLRIMI